MHAHTHSQSMPTCILGLWHAAGCVARLILHDGVSAVHSYTPNCFGSNWRQTLRNGAFESGNSIYLSRATRCAFQNAIPTTFALENELQRLGRCICEYLVHKSAPPRVKPYPNTTQHQHSAFVVLKHAFHAVWATCKTQRGAC